MPLPLPGGRRNYNPLSSTDVGEESRTTTNDGHSGLANDHGLLPADAAANSLELGSKVMACAKIQNEFVTKEGDESQEDESDGGERIQLIVLDSAQHRFLVDVNPDWTVEKLKKEGEKTHKISPASQRLIFQGKMLADSCVLRDSGIESDGVIVHLVSAIRRLVVVTSSNTTSSASCSNAQAGAHVPEIVLDAEEQERRGQILVLGSVEIAEAQNNVKLLSLSLLVVCSMHLLALFSLAMGVAEDSSLSDDAVPSNSTSNHTDDGYFGPGDYESQVRPWKNSDYFDLVVSSIGFYVATLGMKATTENTFRLATAYFIGTIIAGIGWNLWNVFMYAAFVDEKSESEALSRDDYVTVAFFTVLLPMLVWGLCVARAYEFRRLIEEAELEAAERIRSQLPSSEDNIVRDDISAVDRHMLV
eukprot:scaffold2637_cov153-Cylindrotheca_fusiformis.AAC.9